MSSQLNVPNGHSFGYGLYQLTMVSCGPCKSLALVPVHYAEYKVYSPYHLSPSNALPEQAPPCRIC